MSYHYCDKELKLALKHNKRIIPWLHVDRITYETWLERNPQGTPEEWEEYQAKGLHSASQNIHPILRKINRIDGREGQDDFEKALEQLLEICDRSKDYVNQHTLILARALEWERNQKQTQYLLIGEERQQAEEWLSIRFTEEQAPCLPSDLHCEFITESIKNANNMMTQVFLCHAAEDRESAEQIRRSLLRRGITVWNYRTDIQTSQDYNSAIAQGVESADNVLFILSPHSAQSVYCQRELAQALALQKRIIPILAAPIEEEKVPEGLRSLQQIDLTDNVDDSDYLADESELLKILSTDAAYHTEHKTWLTQALKWERQHQNPTMLLRGYNLRRAEAWLKIARTHRYTSTDLQKTFIDESLRQPPDPSLDVFISYSRVDSDFARRLNETLQIQGKRTWFDQESIASGTDFQQEIYGGIESSDVFLFVLSPQSINSPFCADEVEYAHGLNKRIVTVLHRPIDTVDLHPVLAKLQWLDFRAYNGDFQVNVQNLLRILDTDREHLESHTRLLLRAVEWSRKGRDESLLLRGQELATAEHWLVANVEVDPKPTGLQQEYVRASTAREIAQEAAVRRLRRGALIGTVAAGAGIFVAVGTGWYAQTQTQKATAAQEAAKVAQQEADSRIAEADARVAEANTKVDVANQLAENAAKQTQQAKEEQQQAETAAEQAVQAQKNAEARAREADGKAQSATVAQQQAEAKAQEAEGRVRAADNKTAAAEKAQQLAQDGTRLEQAGVAALNRLDFDTVGALSNALKAVKALSEIAAQEGLKAVSDYPAASPVLALQQIQSRIGKDRLLAHKDSVRSASFSTDGQRVLTASDDGTARVWDVASGDAIAVLEAPDSSVRSASFSPDGQQVVTLSFFSGTVRVWDVATQDAIAVLEGHADGVIRAAFSNDGQRVVTASWDRTARVWDVASGNAIAVLEGYADGVTSATFSTDGERVVTASDDGTARVWDVATQDTIAVLEGHTGFVWSAAFSPDGQRVVTASKDGTARVWDVARENAIAVLEGHTDGVSSAVFSTDGQRVMTASDDGTVRVWDVASGNAIAVLEGHADGVTSAAFSPDGERVMTASYDGTARVWDVKGRQLAIYKGSRAAFSPNGQRVATVVDGRVKVYDIQTLPELVDWGCQWLHNYLEYGQSTDAERELCGLPPRNPEAAQSTRRESVFSSVVNWMREAWEPFS